MEVLKFPVSPEAEIRLAHNAHPMAEKVHAEDPQRWTTKEKIAAGTGLVLWGTGMMLGSPALVVGGFVILGAAGLYYAVRSGELVKTFDKKATSQNYSPRMVNLPIAA
jgi:hypothetical protein